MARHDDARGARRGARARAARSSARAATSPTSRCANVPRASCGRAVTPAPRPDWRSGADCPSRASPPGSCARSRRTAAPASPATWRPRCGRRSMRRPVIRAESRRRRARRLPVVVPIPTSRAAFRRRGYRVVELVARRAGLRCARLLFTARAHRRSAGPRPGRAARNVAGIAASRGMPRASVSSWSTTS